MALVKKWQVILDYGPPGGCYKTLGACDSFWDVTDILDKAVTVGMAADMRINDQQSIRIFYGDYFVEEG